MSIKKSGAVLLGLSVFGVIAMNVMKGAKPKPSVADTMPAGYTPPAPVVVPEVPYLLELSAIASTRTTLTAVSTKTVKGGTAMVYDVPELGKVTFTRSTTKGEAWEFELADKKRAFEDLFDSKVLGALGTTPDAASGRTWADVLSGALKGSFWSRETKTGVTRFSSLAWQASYNNRAFRTYLCAADRLPGVKKIAPINMRWDCRGELSKQLKDSSRASFPNYKNEDDYQHSTDDFCNPHVVSWVEAPNSFGVMLHQTYDCKYDNILHSYVVTMGAR